MTKRRRRCRDRADCTKQGPRQYGRPVEEWLDLVRSSPPAKHAGLVSWLKAEHGLGHGHANALVAYVRAEKTEDAGN
ncbi:DUF4287 domain-containing protein [Streptomyces rubiginosohelvolus]|uniref:DUF4287 domain-containing protein n=1 Tax=Streptomyces rubiginosohelvolus TaxID=67362 RepID=UPI0036DF4BE7